MKLLGLILIVSCCSLAGISLSLKLSDRLRILEEMLTLLRLIRRELMLTHAPCVRILEQINAQCNAKLLEKCLQNCVSAPFPQAWKLAVAEELYLLRQEQKSAVSSVGTILGSGDLQSQEEALLQCEKQLEEYITEEKENSKTHGKLCSSLGVLSGIMVAVLLL